MKRFSGLIDKISMEMDKLAGLCTAGTMVLVVCNVLLRKILKLPILGTYEVVGYLSALTISLALARCAFRKGHIALDFLIKKFSVKTQLLASTLVDTAALLFLSLCMWHLVLYARSLMLNGTVSATAQLPVYPIVFVIALGVFGLCLVLLLKTCESWKAMLTEIIPSSFQFRRQPGLLEEAEKAGR